MDSWFYFNTVGYISLSLFVLVVRLSQIWLMVAYLRWLFLSFWHVPYYSVSIFLLPGTANCSKLILNFPCYYLKFVISSRSLVSFSEGCFLETRIWTRGGLICSELMFLLGLVCVQRLGICLCTYFYIHIHTLVHL